MTEAALKLDHRKAVSCETLLQWAFGHHGADVIVDSMSHSGPIRASNADLWTLGTRTDGRGLGGCLSLERLTETTPADAREIYRIVLRCLSYREWLALRPFARKGTAPDWGEELHRWTAAHGTVLLKPNLVEGDGGFLRPEVCRRCCGRTVVEYCTLETEDLAPELQAQREIYSAWWRIMDRLAGEIATHDSLANWTCSGVAHGKTPWIEKNP